MTYFTPLGDVVAKSQKPDFVVPEEAAKRGPIMSGELSDEHHRYPSLLVQFPQITPNSRKARIHLFPTTEQAKKLYGANGPFKFKASFTSREGVVETRIADDVWLKPSSQIVHQEAIYWTQTSGQIGNLEINTTYLPGPQLEARSTALSGWFTARRCFALQILANADEEEKANAAKYGFTREDVAFTLSDNAEAVVQRYKRFHRMGTDRETAGDGYSILVKNFKSPLTAKRDVDAFLVLASFASRERTLCAHWSHECKEAWIRYWRFNHSIYPPRREREEPLVPRDREECHAFMQKAFDTYSASTHQALLDSAVYALMAKERTLEVSIAQLFSGIQGALMFATQYPASSSRPQIGVLYRKFLKKQPKLFDDLWPLLDPRSGAPLVYFRNAIVHGDAFSEEDWLALSYAAENLQWHLERIILVALGWDVEKSAVAAGRLRLFYAHQWQKVQSTVKRK